MSHITYSSSMSSNSSTILRSNSGTYLTYANSFYSCNKTYNVLGSSIELPSNSSIGIVIALINTLGYEVYDNIKDQCELPTELINLMEEKKIQYNRDKNIDKLLK